MPATHTLDGRPLITIDVVLSATRDTTHPTCATHGGWRDLALSSVLLLAVSWGWAVLSIYAVYSLYMCAQNELNYHSFDSFRWNRIQCINLRVQTRRAASLEHPREPARHICVCVCHLKSTTSRPNNTTQSDQQEQRKMLDEIQRNASGHAMSRIWPYSCCGKALSPRRAVDRGRRANSSGSHRGHAQALSTASPTACERLRRPC